MKGLRKSLTLAVVGVALVLGVFFLTSNAQRRGRGGVSFSVSSGQPYYPQHRFYRRYARPTRYYVTQPNYGYGYSNGYYNNGHYNNGYYNNGYYNNNRRYSRSGRFDVVRDCERARSYTRNAYYRDRRRNW